MKQQMYAFDTHKAVKELTQAGAQTPLAEAMVSTLNTMVRNLPTREDIDSKLDALRQEFKNDLHHSEKRIITVLGLIMSVFFGVSTIF